jgi:hypothetical protein
VFALDAFEPGQTIWHQILAFIIHLIPSFILIILLIVAWKWEKKGGIILFVAGLAWGFFLIRINYMNHRSFLNVFYTFMALAFPFILSGVLFIISHYLKEKDLRESKDIPAE